MNVTDSDWDMDYDKDRKYSKEEDAKDEPKYEMATVEIDVNDAQEVMEDVLTKWASLWLHNVSRAHFKLPFNISECYQKGG